MASYYFEERTMETTPLNRFDESYRARTPPWVIGEPQPAVVELEKAGQIRGVVLDAGCGAGEHTIHLANLGYDVLGVDFSPAAVELARANAEAKGVNARFDVVDALRLPAEARYDTVVDSALFHVFGDADRRDYVHSLAGACRQGGIVHVLALSDQGPGFGPQISDTTIRDAFDDGWVIEELRDTSYRGIVTRDVEVNALGATLGSTVDLPAWLARIRRSP
jgi:SAM-dependent methyltransferase